MLYSTRRHIKEQINLNYTNNQWSHTKNLPVAHIFVQFVWKLTAKWNWGSGIKNCTVDSKKTVLLGVKLCIYFHFLKVSIIGTKTNHCGIVTFCLSLHRNVLPTRIGRKGSHKFTLLPKFQGKEITRRRIMALLIFIYKVENLKV